MSKQNYSKLVTLAAWAATLAATLMIITKLFAWIVTGSSSILASLTDSLMDVAASGINLIAVKISLTPADDEHRFGHGKAESLAGLAQAAFISGSSCLLILNGFSALVKGQTVEEPGLGIWVMVFSIIVTLALVTFQNHVVKRTGSVAIKADSLHYKSDIIMNLAVLVALGLSSFGLGWADGLFAIGVGFYIMYSAWQIGKQSVDALMDKHLPKEDEKRILNTARNIDNVCGIHDLRTRQSGSTTFIQLHLELDDDLSLFEAHAKAEILEQALEKLYPDTDIIIHLDPASVVPKERAQNKIMFES